MATLTSSPAADVLRELYARAARSHTVDRDRPRAALPDEAVDTRAHFLAAKDRYMAVRPATGDLLHLLARARRARSIVEFGTSFGVSTLCLAAALRDNGGGRLIGTDFVESKAEAARRSLDEAGVGDLVEIRVGDALETLAADVPEPVDLLFLDGAKDMYLDVLHLLEPRLAPDALVVADNADRADAFVAHVRADAGYLAVAAPGNVELAVRLA